MIRHLLWETDDVLFDTHPAVTYAISQSLNEMGCAIALNVVDGLARQSLENCVDTLAARFKLDSALLRQRSAEHYRQIPPERQLPFPGVREVCAWVVAGGGLNLIVTDRQVASTRALLSAHAMTDFFSDIFSLEQGYPCKPNPWPFCLPRLKTRPQSRRTLLIRPPRDATLLVDRRRRGDLSAGQERGDRFS